MLYFNHDVEAHKDEKIIVLRKKFGGAAVDAYWTILETMYRDETELKPSENPLVLSSLAVFLCVEEEQLEQWVEGMCSLGLLEQFEDEDGCLAYMSPRAESNIEGYQRKRKASQENGKLGGHSRKNAGENGNKTQQEPSENLAKTQQEPSENQKIKDKSKKKDKENPPNPPRGEAEEFPFDEVIGYLNAKTSRNFKASTESYRKHIRARCKEGYTLDDFKRVIDGRCAVWNKPPKPGDDKDTRDWLNPETLFRAGNFDRYLNGVSSAIPTEEVSSLAAKYANAY